MRKRGKYQYNPYKAPKPYEWLALEEEERIALVVDYHVKQGIEAPNMQLHATFHAVVETQVVEGDSLPIKAAIERLKSEGLDRHDAIHAVASVLTGHFWNIMRGDDDDKKLPEAYYEQVRQLTKEKWYKEFGQ